MRDHTQGGGENGKWHGNPWGGEMEIVCKIMYVGLGGYIACNAY